MSTSDRHALVIDARDAPGTLSAISQAIAARGANIRSIESLAAPDAHAALSVEVEHVDDIDALIADVRALPCVTAVSPEQTFRAIYGKRVIVIGGGAQVAQVAVGAISEADRHNIRGERISVDTIPLVGEKPLAEAVRAVARLPRARVLVLAGALMGGEITAAVHDVRTRGIIVISLKMVGSVRAAADLVVTDPLQAGVMSVMAIADTASFDIAKQRGREY